MIILFIVIISFILFLWALDEGRGRGAGRNAQKRRYFAVWRTTEINHEKEYNMEQIKLYLIQSVRDCEQMMFLSGGNDLANYARWYHTKVAFETIYQKFFGELETKTK